MMTPLTASDGVERGPDGTPVAFRIWKAGENPTEKGMTIFSETSAKMLLAEQERRANLYSIDFDHLSLSKDAPPEARRAAGWFRIDARNGELWAIDVAWTPVAKAGLQKDPPEFRYFSPAYDVSKDTREVTSLLNMALTNSPATWANTALATRTATALASRAGSNEGSPMKYDDLMAHLAAMAGGDDKEEAKKAKAAMATLKASEDPDGDTPVKEPKKDAECPPDETKKDAEDPPKEEPSKEEPKKDAIAASAFLSELASTVQAQAKELASMRKDREDNERASILASRKDLGEALVKTLTKMPIALMKETIAGLPAQKAPSVTQAHATRGHDQSGTGGSEQIAATRMSAHADRLDQQMGMSKRANAIRTDGNSMVCGVMTPTEARAHLKKIEARTAAIKEGH